MKISEPSTSHLLLHPALTIIKIMAIVYYVGRPHFQWQWFLPLILGVKVYKMLNLSSRARQAAIFNLYLFDPIFLTLISHRAIPHPDLWNSKKIWANSYQASNQRGHGIFGNTEV